MAIRIYPIRDSPSSKQAIQSQKWQSSYFLDASNPNDLNTEKINDFYSCNPYSFPSIECSLNQVMK
ncbi:MULTISPECIES: MepB family protein [Planococcus]|uniref:MepB family protein n=1 Tax=Planococcus TaxID=1372 RepID=UPI00203E5B44|nr:MULTISPECIES: MepB family protein [Planococcus]